MVAHPRMVVVVLKARSPNAMADNRKCSAFVNKFSVIKSYDAMNKFVISAGDCNDRDWSQTLC